MQNVSKQIYRELKEVLPELEQLAPFDRIHLADRGLPGLNAVVFESVPGKVNFILSRHVAVNGRTVANPCFEISVNPEMKMANVVTYKDDHYFQTPVPDEAGTMAQVQANRLLYGWLTKLKEKRRMLIR